jgi:hypothetical protein
VAPAEREQGAALRLEAKRSPALTPEGRPVEAGQLGPNRVADDYGLIPWHPERGGRLRDSECDGPGDPSGQTVRDAGHGVLLVQDDRDPCPPGSDCDRQRDVRAHAADHVEPIPADEPLGGQSAADGRERGGHGLDGGPPEQRQNRQQVEREASFRHGAGLDPPRSPRKADHGGRVVVRQSPSQREPGEHVPATPACRDQDPEARLVTAVTRHSRPSPCGEPAEGSARYQPCQMVVPPLDARDD